MTKAEVLELLQRSGIQFTLQEHKAVFTMAELADVPLLYPEGDAKNLFLRNDKRTAYYLVTLRGNKQLDLKSFRKAWGTSPLSFASGEELAQHLHLSPGSVTPLGILNDASRSVPLYLDRDLFRERGMIGVHPNDNTATLWLKTEDLVRLLTQEGATVQIADLP